MSAPITEYPPELQESVAETKAHIEAVRHELNGVIDNLNHRRLHHDDSKLEEPEVSGFHAMTHDGRLKEMTYGSEEYRSVLREHKPTIDHHYGFNDHHPEHFPGGIAAMSLMSITEMLCDWRAATSRMKDGDIRSSIEKNQARFGYSDEMKQILLNTAHDLGWI